jgi:hypothetical protein
VAVPEIAVIGIIAASSPLDVSLVTDHGVEIPAGGVTSQTIDRVLEESHERLELREVIPRIGPQPDECASAGAPVAGHALACPESSARDPRRRSCP